MALHIQVVDDTGNPIKDTKVSVFGSTVIGGWDASKTDELGNAVLLKAIRGKATLIISHSSEKLEIIEKFDYREGAINIVRIIGNTLALVADHLEPCNT